MKRAFWFLLLSIAVGSCAAVPQRNVDLVNRAVDAMGGAEAYARVQTLAVKGNLKQWEPEQSHTPGGEMRHANDSTFETTTDVGARSVRVDWVKKFAYPAPRTFTFSEIVTPGAGYVLGQDANNLCRQAMQTKPPAHAMSGLRLTATPRELHRISPLLMREMRNHPGRLSGSPDVTVGGVAYPAVNYNAGAYTFTVLFDPRSGLPTRNRSFDYDNIWGDVTFDVVLSGWTSMGGVRVVANQKYELNGRVITDINLTEVAVNPALQSFVNGVKKAGIQPLLFAGGHGATVPYALLVGLAGH